MLDDGDPGSLSESEQQAVGSHIQTCASCAAQWNAQIEFNAMRVPPVPADLESRCFERIASASAPRATRRRGGPVLLGSLLLGAAAAALIGTSWHGSGDDPLAELGAGQSAAPTTGGGGAIPSTGPSQEAPASGPAAVAGIAGIQDDTTTAPAPSAAVGAFTVELTRLVSTDAGPLEIQFGDWFHASLVDKLQAVPNLVLIEADEHREWNFVPTLGIPGPGERPPPPVDTESANWPDSYDFRLAAGAAIRDNRIRMIFNVSSAKGGRSGRSTSENLEPGESPQLQQAEALAARVSQELRAETFPASAPDRVGQFNELESRFSDQSLGPEERFRALNAAAQTVRRANNQELVTRFVDSALALLPQIEAQVLASSEFGALLASLPADEQAAAREEAAGAFRASIWRELGDTGDTRLIAPLIDALRYDPSTDVRLAAVRILGEFVDDAAARATLEWAADWDPSDEVRDIARRHVLDGSGQLDEIVRILRDTSLSDTERLDPIRYSGEELSRVARGSRFDPMTVQVIAELVSRSDIQSRRQILLSLSTTQSASLVPLFIERLRSDPAPEVRAAAAMSLRPHLALADARVALELAAAGDPSEEVRFASEAVRVR